MMKSYRTFIQTVNMGSIEVYDTKLRKSYEPDYEKCCRQVKDMSEGYVEYDPMGQYVVGCGTRHRRLNDMEAQIQQQQQPVINLVTPVAQRLERAKSELELLRKEKMLENAWNGQSGTKRRKKNRAHRSQQVDWNALRY